MQTPLHVLFLFLFFLVSENMVKNCLLCLTLVLFFHTSTEKCVKNLDLINWTSLVDRLIVTNAAFDQVYSHLFLGFLPKMTVQK